MALRRPTVILPLTARWGNQVFALPSEFQTVREDRPQQFSTGLEEQINELQSLHQAWEAPHRCLRRRYFLRLALAALRQRFHLAAEAFQQTFFP